MVSKVGPTALALVFAALFAAGCGDDEKSTDTGSDAPPAVSTPAESTETTAAEEPDAVEDSGGSVADDPRVQEAIDACKAQVDSNPSINDDIVDDIKAICERAASGDPEDVKGIAKEVCLKVIESSGLEGDIAEQAKQSCESAG